MIYEITPVKFTQPSMNFHARPTETLFDAMGRRVWLARSGSSESTVVLNPDGTWQCNCPNARHYQPQLCDHITSVYNKHWQETAAERNRLEQQQQMAKWQEQQAAMEAEAKPTGFISNPKRKIDLEQP
jgi:hypothetical protein